MESAARKFEAKDAARGSLWLALGIIGPSGGGKTYSAHRLAAGMQRVSGGDIYMIDTEACRGLHYADKFKFKHVELTAPFSPMDYLAAIEYCYKQGARTIIVDSMSHEHEGEGGVLEMHQKEALRMAKGDLSRIRSVDMLAWGPPKQAHQRLVNSILQMKCNFIFCFRAKEKIKPDKSEKDGVRDLGWQPIGDMNFLYEMMTCFLLPPGANGVPDWSPMRVDERKMIKLPEQFKGLYSKSSALSEAHGEVMKRWADGATIESAMAAAKGKVATAPVANDTSSRFVATDSMGADSDPPEPGSDG